MTDLHAVLLQGQWFAALPQALQQALVTQGRPLQLETGQRLFSRGDPPGGLYAVLSGAMRIGTVDAQGKEALLILVEAPHWFGEIALFDGQPRTHDAIAEITSTLLHLPQAGLLSLLDAHPAYWRHIALLMAHKVRLAFITLEEMSLLPAAQRLARRLLLIVDDYGETRGPRRIIHLAQDQLAAMLAISRQTANRLLNDLQVRGIVQLTYGEIEILDLDGLRQAAQ
ncbi:cAMP-binding domain of CRP or a regulatory subunit of cAMP-dependent protein kinases [Pseudomonas flavescens]|uniref:cAMP-binding domain of CRP or a regulatory subunit of cAMP-dependent protein kinases n=1 Tax=Phytopseudomonas flavescens TaxID=29435 RepID=A0A1G8N3A0_9GAMM|nr:Crp/Fnr family transcriptional regulator [Pseudomonas flavescens]SDI74050.1 cAMP-binding domain of CRP or a regulatory subunit of cAMP-dependent protein kinases [Pseudomonas flavescens]